MSVPGYTVGPDHRLAVAHGGREVYHHHRTPNTNGRTIVPTLLVLHYTAGGAAAGTVAWLCNRDAKASAHLVVGRVAGEVYQLAPLDHDTWHAGRSSFRGRSGCNAFSLGVEICNWGPLKRAGARYLDGRGVAVDPAAVVLATADGEDRAVPWEVYPAHQVETVAQVCAALLRRYPSIQDLAGHSDIAPGRKRDPGPAFPWAPLRRRVAELLSANPKSKP